MPRLRYRLGTLLLVIAVVGLALGLVAQKQREAALLAERERALARVAAYVWGEQDARLEAILLRLQREKPSHETPQIPKSIGNPSSYRDRSPSAVPKRGQ